MKPRPKLPEGKVSEGELIIHRNALLDWYSELEFHPHVQEVMKIPADEPIFVLRSQDVEGPEGANFWLGLTQATVDTNKFLSAAKRYQEMLEWQNANRDRVKIPD